MADSSSTLIPKGPLKKPTAASNTTSYTEKPTGGGDMSLMAGKKGKRSKQDSREAKSFDSSYIISPFLEPKILERRVQAANKAQR